MRSGMSDRPLRDLTALRFFPAMENLDITDVEVNDLTPLAVMPNLNWLTLMEGSGLGGRLSLQFRRPRSEARARPRLPHSPSAWPDLTAMAAWTALRDLTYHGNLLALSSVETLPAVRSARSQSAAIPPPRCGISAFFPPCPP